MWRQAVLALLIISGVTYAVAGSNLREAFIEKPLPILGVLPELSLVDQDDDRFNARSIDGEPAVFSFFFTSCRGPCPLLNGALLKVIKAVAGSSSARFVSISIDPENDDPAALKAYAQKMSAPSNWRFLTGPKDEIYRFAEQGLKLGVDEGELIHSTSVALVDGAQAIRGYYRITDPAEQQRLVEDIQRISQ